MVLSPAKNMNFDPVPGAPKATKPSLLKDAIELGAATRKLTRGKIKSLMNVNDKLADLNYQRFQAFEGKPNGHGAKQAALAFNGDVYFGLEAKTLDKEDFKYAQDHLRILSGLYGLLRPLDGIEPYRLEMGSRLKNARGADLYAFWGEKIAKEINIAVKAHQDRSVVNLASHEYFGAVDLGTLGARVVTPVFKDEKDGKLRSLQFFAKRARGAMARWAIQKRIKRAADLKKCDAMGYKFREGDSSDDLWVFSRPQPPKKN